MINRRYARQMLRFRAHLSVRRGVKYLNVPMWCHWWRESKREW